MKTPFVVPYTALTQYISEVKGELMQAVEKVLDGGRFILGSQVAEFEKEFAAFCQVAHASGLANGTCALHLVLRALGAAGGEVITVPNSFIATAASISLAGGRPVFADIRPDLNLDPNKIEAAITPKTRGILAVHLTGRPAPMADINDIAKRHNLFVVEDAAQAIGASLNGKRVGGWGTVGCFSLHPLKNLHAYGDAGIMTTNDPEMLKQMTLARNHGLANRDRCDFFSYNCRLDEIQAAMLRVNFRHLERRTEERRTLAARYNVLLAPHVQVPVEGPGEYCVYATYVVHADQRDALHTHLVENGVEAMIHYPTPTHLQPAAQNLGYEPQDFPVAMECARRILTLPLFPGMTEAQQNLVVDLIKSFYKDKAKRSAA